MSDERLILVPGMGADERLFEPQKTGGLRFEVVRFSVPGRHDTLPAYARRIARQLDLDASCVIGGVSFGGMVACELARIRPPRRLLLVASCRRRECMPGYYSLLELSSRLVPDGLIRRRAEASSRLLARLESLNEQQAELIRAMSRDAPIPLLRRIGHMIVRWKGVSDLSCPVHHIHGRRDHIIPIRRLNPEEVVPEAGHLVSMTHADRVNSFIRRLAAS